MALGKIKADTLEHSTAGSLDTSYVVNGSCKAWSHVNGAGTTINDSLNVATYTDSGTGQGYQNYTNSMNSAFYCQTNFSQWTDPASGNAYSVDGAGNVETTRCRHLHYENGSLTDPQQRFINIQGDLA